MTKKFTLKQLYSIVDGRLSTDIDDVYEMLNHICDDNLYTHHLPVAFKYLKKKNPLWFRGVQTELENHGAGKDVEFADAMEALEKYNPEYDIPQLKDEFDTSDFGEFMIDNSLLPNR